MPFTVVETSWRYSRAPKYVRKKTKPKRESSTRICKLLPVQPGILLQCDNAALPTEIIKFSVRSTKTSACHSAFEDASETSSGKRTNKDGRVLLTKHQERAKEVPMCPLQYETTKISKSLTAAPAIQTRISAGRLRFLLRRWSTQLSNANTGMALDHRKRSDINYPAEDEMSRTSDMDHSTKIDMSAKLDCTVGDRLWHNAYQALIQPVNYMNSQSTNADFSGELDEDLGSAETSETCVSVANNRSGATKDKCGPSVLNLMHSSSEGSLVRAAVSDHVTVVMAEEGYTHFKFAAVEVLCDVVQDFLHEVAERLKNVKEREISGLDHGFPDPMERVLTDLGMWGIRGLE